MKPKGNRPICAITGGAKRVGRAVAGGVLQADNLVIRHIAGENQLCETRCFRAA